MADTMTRTDELKIEALFEDYDTRIITLKNCRSNINSNEIVSLETIIKTDNLLVGDKNSAAFKKINYAKRVRTARTTLDISQ